MLGLNEGDPFVTKLAWNPNGKQLAGRNKDGEIVLWDASQAFEFESNVQYIQEKEIEAAAKLSKIRSDLEDEVRHWNTKHLNEKIIVRATEGLQDHVKPYHNQDDYVRVRINEVDYDIRRQQIFGPNVDSILVYAQAGDDRVELDNDLDIPAILDGGLGDDRLTAGRGDSVLLARSGRRPTRGRFGSRYFDWWSWRGSNRRKRRGRHFELKTSIDRGCAG